MKQSERKLLMELRRLLNSVPFPRVDSIDGLVGYTEDMRRFLPAIAQVLEGLALQDWPGIEEMRPEEGIDYHDPVKVLAALDTWIRGRIASNWSRPVPALDIWREDDAQ